MPGTAVFLRNARRFFRSNISTSRVEGQYRNWYRRVNPLCGSSHSTMNANFSVGSACVVRARETRVRRGRNRSADGGKRKSLSRGATRRSRAFGCDANSVSKPPRSGTQRSPARMRSAEDARGCSRDAERVDSGKTRTAETIVAVDGVGVRTAPARAALGARDDVSENFSRRTDRVRRLPGKTARKAGVSDERRDTPFHHHSSRRESPGQAACASPSCSSKRAATRRARTRSSCASTATRRSGARRCPRTGGRTRPTSSRGGTWRPWARGAGSRGRGGSPC